MSAEAEPNYDGNITEKVEYTVEDVNRLGRCRGQGILTPLFFSVNELDGARAKAICAKCVVREACLQFAIEREEPWGTWGGEFITDGKIVQTRRTGRPSTVPRVIGVDPLLI